MRQLSGLDASFLNLETSSTPLHVGSCVILDPSEAPDGFGFDRLHDHFAERVRGLRPFRERLVGVPLGIDHPYWIVDPDFDLEFHLRHSGLPPPGGARELAEVIARLHARPLDRAHPLWETYVIEGLAEDRVAVFTKVHHAAVDGVSGAELAAALLDLEAEPQERELPEPLVAEEEPGPVGSVALGAVGLVRQPRRLARTAVRTAKALPVVGRAAQAAIPDLLGSRSRDGGLIAQPRLQSPRTPFNGTITGHRRWAFGTLSLDRVKAIKNAAGATVNDVIMAMCAGALRRFLVDREALPDSPLQAMVPISVRTDEERGSMGNRVTAMVATLPTDAADPRRRLERVASSTGAARDANAVPAQLLQDFTQFATPAIAASAARVVARTRWARYVQSPFNLVISNIPGPQFPLYLGGAKVEHYYPVSAIHDGIGLNITVQSYLGGLDFGLVSCRELVPDLWDLMDLLGVELDTLAEVTGVS